MKAQLAEDKMTKSQLFLLSIVSLLAIVMPLGDAGGLITVCLAVGGLVAFFNKDAMKACRWVLIIWGVYSLLYGLSALWSVVPKMVIGDLRKENLYTVFAFALSFAAFYKAKEKSKDVFIYAVLFGGVILSAMQMIDHFGIQVQVLTAFTQKHLPGVGDASTLLVLFFALSFYLFVTKQKTKICVGVLYQVLIVYAAFLTQNRMAFVCFALIYAVYVFGIVWRLSIARRTVIVAVMLPLAATLFFFGFGLKAHQHQNAFEQVESVSKHDPRLYMWDFYLDKAFESPVLGYGAGYAMPRETFKGEFPSNFNHLNKIHAHNVLLNKQLQMGVIGLALFMLLYGLAFKKSVLPFKHDQITVVALLVFVGYFAKSMTDDFFIRNSLLLFWILIGFFMNANRVEESK
ncbi:hypothetical protein A3K86_08705 [Photobacterium jeanii]|uniref:O-antigen ligase-related domain-containing protein n=1 Tax=Photobacterium jeanii TaxID=858640 RepID=A0A178KJV0_9GAMM|nr:O-antigen ligase family protein [Photobacterium jeanii]OAN17004.1 hypothetical protein A3K86_08705 [Photobacterium jeanii]PST88294.1 hypothetical protein C9I91_17015 [Photobacterium jeanii]